MKKHLANMISGLRILGSTILILFFNEFSTTFLIIYCISAATDMFDGYVARKTNSCSVTGVVMDTVGDIMISAAMVKVLIVQKMVPSWMLVWLSIIVLIFVGICAYSKKKFGKFFFPHTYFDKLIGVAVAIMPLTLVGLEKAGLNYQYYMIFIGVLLSITAVDTTVIQIKCKTAKDFVPSMFHAGKD